MSSLNVKVVQRKGTTRKKIEELINKKNDFVEIGHFEAQGTHPTIGRSYVDLMKLHHNGGTIRSNVPNPPRPVMHILNFKAEKVLMSPQLRKEGEALLKSGAKDPLIIVGKRLAAVEKSIFGDPSLLTSNAESTIAAKHGADTPLVETGELRSKVAYRTSKSKIIKEI